LLPRGIHRQKPEIRPFTTRLEVLLAERAGATVRRLVKPSGTAPSPPALIDDAAQADVAVVGIGL